MTAEEIIAVLKMKPHPEGGYWAPAITQPGNPESGSAFSHIYYLLPRGCFSAVHRLRADELWHLYEGGPLVIRWLDIRRKEIREHLLDPERGRWYCLIPAGTWFMVEPAEGAEFALAGCTVVPAYEEHMMEMGHQEALQEHFPSLKKFFQRYCIQ